MNIAQSKLLEIEARLRSLAAAILGVLPEQSGNSGKFLKTDGTAASWDTPVGGSGGNAVYVQEGGAAEADSSAADLTVNFADADFDVTTVGQTSSVAINDGGIAHSGLAGTHNLTTDIDHGAIGGLADDDHTQYHNDTRGDARYAPIAKGVTNGDSHDHAGGDGAQIPEGGLSIANAPAAGDILTWNGSAMEWDQSVAFTPSAITKVTGGAESGSASDIAAIDSSEYTVAEVTGTPGFNIEVSFAAVDKFNRVRLHMLYDGSLAHNVTIDLYNYTTVGWDNLDTVNGQADWTALEYTVADSTDYISAGAAKVRVYHSSAGNAAHDLHLDMVNLGYDIVSGVGVSEHGLLTGLADDDHIQYHTDARGDLRYLQLAAFGGLAKITVSSSAPGTPGAGDLWVDTS